MAACVDPVAAQPVSVSGIATVSAHIKASVAATLARVIGPPTWLLTWLTTRLTTRPHMRLTTRLTTWPHMRRIQLRLPKHSIRVPSAWRAARRAQRVKR